MGSELSHKEYIEDLTGKFKADRYAPNDREMLILLISCADGIKDPAKTADNLLQRFGSYRGCFSAKHDELCSVEGMTRNAATLLCLTAKLCSVKDIDSFVGRYLSELCELFSGISCVGRGELLYIIALDGNDKVLAVDKCISDNPHSVSFEIRDVVDLAARAGACKVVLAHTHPTEESTAMSNADKTAADIFGAILSERGIEFVGIDVIAGGKYKLHRHKKR